MMLITSILVAIHAFVLAQTQFLWADTFYVKTMLSLWVMMGPITMVCVLALGMTVCSSKCSATQFAIYMSCANLGASAGSKFYGMISEHSNYVQSYTYMGMMFIVLIVVLLLFRHRPSTDDAQISSSNKARRRQHTFGVNGHQSGIYWSGAIRCPKCRADMEQVDIDGTIIDRCEHCSGIWFDAGEMEDILSNQAAVKRIDTGDQHPFNRLNSMDDYDCPRCGGEMLKRIDDKQKHIWYETCTDCDGSFFDAGEVLDLSQHTVSDFFKSLMASKR